jgi:hypothetical protein
MVQVGKSLVPHQVASQKPQTLAATGVPLEPLIELDQVLKRRPLFHRTPDPSGLKIHHRHAGRAALNVLHQQVARVQIDVPHAALMSAGQQLGKGLTQVHAFPIAPATIIGGFNRGPIRV